MGWELEVASPTEEALTALALGRRLGALGLERIGVEVTAVRRRGIRAFDPEPDTVLEPGDIVVLRGQPEALEAAEARMLAG